MVYRRASYDIRVSQGVPQGMERWYAYISPERYYTVAAEPGVPQKEIRAEVKRKTGKDVGVLESEASRKRSREMEKKFHRSRRNPAKRHKVPFLRRQDALALATQVAVRGWAKRPATPDTVEYWEKDVPGGEINVISSEAWLRDYDLQFVSDHGVVTKLGGSRGSLRDAKIKAVLEALKRDIEIVNPQLVRNLAPPKTKWISGAIKHPGKLSKLAKRLGLDKKPFMKRSMAEQKKILDLCMVEYGYRSCLGSTLLLRNLPAIKADPRSRARATALKDYLVSRYGGPGSFGPRSNPPDGEWEAVPVVLMYVHIGKAKLTATQITQLTVETM